MSPNPGPISYENWQAFLRGLRSNYAFEYPLFTDAHITGEIVDECGPYRLLNTVPLERPGLIAPAIVLRIEEHVQQDSADRKMTKTDTARYHGGWLSDEIAALLSLSLGIRLQSGGCTRMFEYVKGDVVD